jgi:hypothetical protein
MKRHLKGIAVGSALIASFGVGNHVQTGQIKVEEPGFYVAFINKKANEEAKHIVVNLEDERLGLLYYEDFVAGDLFVKNVDLGTLEDEVELIAAQELRTRIEERLDEASNE